MVPGRGAGGFPKLFSQGRAKLSHPGRGGPSDGGWNPMTKILIVDDEPSILESTDLLLSDVGFDVVTNTDTTRTLALLREERPDVLLQDVRMPGLDLEALLTEIRADPDVKETPVILFSANLDLGDLQERLEVPAVVEKPFSLSEVMGAIERATAASPSAAAHERGVSR